MAKRLAFTKQALRLKQTGTKPKLYQISDIFILEREKCDPCNKRIYDTERAVQDAVRTAKRQGTYLRDYPEDKCGNYHLSSQKQRHYHRRK